MSDEWQIMHDALQRVYRGSPNVLIQNTLSNPQKNQEKLLFLFFRTFLDGSNPYAYLYQPEMNSLAQKIQCLVDFINERDLFYKFRALFRGVLVMQQVVSGQSRSVRIDFRHQMDELRKQFFFSFAAALFIKSQLPDDLALAATLYFTSNAPIPISTNQAIMYLLNSANTNHFISLVFNCVKKHLGFGYSCKTSEFTIYLKYEIIGKELLYHKDVDLDEIKANKEEILQRIMDLPAKEIVSHLSLDIFRPSSKLGRGDCERPGR